MLTLNEIGSYRKYADFESVERGEVGRQTQCVVVVRGMTMIILHAFYRLIFTSASKSIGGVAFTDVFIAFLANLVLRLIADFVGHCMTECPDKDRVRAFLAGKSEPTKSAISLRTRFAKKAIKTSVKATPPIDLEADVIVMPVQPHLSRQIRSRHTSCMTLSHSM